jgi:hypothetical protein
MPVTVSMYSDNTCTDFYDYAHSAASVRYYMRQGVVGSYRVMNGAKPECRYCSSQEPSGDGGDCWELPSY